MNPGSNSTARRRGTGDGIWVGVELGSMVIKASVFSKDLGLLGKVKLSTKAERGPSAIIDRIERCVRYAVDDSDCPLANLRGVGVAVSGAGISHRGDITLPEPFKWREVPLRQPLEAKLGCPVVVGDLFNLIALAVITLELPVSSRHAGVAVLVPGAQIGVGVLVNGVPVDLSIYPPEKPILRPGATSVLQETASQRFRSYRSRDFRKAIRNGDRSARQFILRSVQTASRFGARLLGRRVVRRVILAGGAIDEVKNEALAIGRGTLHRELAREQVSKQRQTKRALSGKGRAKSHGRRLLTASNLGDQASLMGAVLLAQQRVRIAGRARRAPGSPNAASTKAPHKADRWLFPDSTPNRNGFSRSQSHPSMPRHQDDPRRSE
jgi:hypothetical protein